jgi:hypothetical protein
MNGGDSVQAGWTPLVGSGAAVALLRVGRMLEEAERSNSETDNYC